MHEHSDVWRTRMKAFLGHCRASAPWEEADWIREALHLKRLGQSAGIVQDLMQEDLMFERLIEQTAFECAALEIIGTEADFDLSGTAARACSASVRLPGQAQPSMGEGQSIALALLAAWATAQLAQADAKTEVPDIDEAPCGGLDADGQPPAAA